MSHWSPSTWAGAAPDPSPVVFDPSAVRADALGVEPVGTVVVLLASAPDLQWAAEAAIELSTAWARLGRRIVLADLHLENPVLHEQVGATNLEGMVDVFLYGASIARSARPVRGRGFYLISAGTYEPDAEAIYQHPRWPKLLAGFRDADASLVLFVPAESADLGAVARWSGEVVLLGAADAWLAGAIAESGLRVRATLVPPDHEPPMLEEPTEEAPVSEASLPVVPAADPELELPPPPVREPRSRRRGVSVALLLLLTMAAVAALGFWLARTRPELFPWGTSRREAVDAPAAPAPGPVPAPTRAGEPLAYSVQVIAYSTAQDAAQQLLQLQRRLPSVPFFIAPEANQDVLYFKIRAGYLADTASAARLKERLLEAGVASQEDARVTELVKHAPLAFDLGEFASPEQAAAAADSLAARRVPSYAVEVPYSDGSRRWQLYAGAYANSAGAEAMARQLREAGLEPKLVLRVGQPAPVTEPGGA